MYLKYIQKDYYSNPSWLFEKPTSAKYRNTLIVILLQEIVKMSWKYCVINIVIGKHW